jgi:hypothetical protein
MVIPDQLPNSIDEHPRGSVSARSRAAFQAVGDRSPWLAFLIAEKAGDDHRVVSGRLWSPRHADVLPGGEDRHTAPGAGRWPSENCEKCPQIEPGQTVLDAAPGLPGEASFVTSTGNRRS